MLDIVFLPWRDIHNYRKEGFRVREGNILNSLSESPDVNKILVVNRAKNFKSVITKTESGMEINSDLWPNKELVYKCFGSKIYKVKENLFSIEMPVYLLNKGDNEIEKSIILQYYLLLVLQNVTKKLKIDLNSKNTCVWSSDLSRSFVFKRLNRARYKCTKIFDTIDNLTQHKLYSEKQRDRNKLRYKLIDENVDLIFSVSESNLRNIYSNSKTKKYFIENGIDINRFKNVNPVQKGNNVIDKKIVCGYVGVIESRINFELIKEIAIKTPSTEFQLVGPVLDDQDPGIQKLMNLKNVKFTGPCSYEEIPTILQNFDICIIPHVINSFTCSMSPLKFYEYLAADKPIIMTGVPPAQDVYNLNGVTIANSIEEWVESIEKFNQIQEELLKYDKDRQKLIKSHSWEQIVKKMINCICSN